MRLKEITTTFLFLICHCLSAQTELIGTVIDQNGNPVEYANVTLHKSADSVLVKGEIADNIGQFKIMVSTPGEYFLQTTFVGYENYFSDNITISGENEKMEIGTISLSPFSAELNEVTVRADKPFIERKLDKLIVNVESSIVASGSNVLKLLEQSPGVFVDQNGTISLRGRTGVIVMMDDKRMRLSGDDLTNLLRGMSASSLETIEIITNPSAKYDAEGSAGIVNLKSKRDKRHGTNGSFTGSAGYGKYEKLNGNLNLNYRDKWVNVFGNYNLNKSRYFSRLLLERKFSDNGQFTQLYDQNNFNLFPSRTHSPRIGVDFFPNKKTTIGVMANGRFTRFENEADNHARILDLNENELGTFSTTSEIENFWNNYTLNMNLRHTIDSTGKLLSADVDYARYWNDTEQLFNTDFFENDILTGTDYLRGDHGGLLQLYSATFDYEHPINGFGKLEAGLKSSYIKSDNDLNFFIKENGEEIFDTRQSNHFIYEENINAGYLNWSNEFGKWNMQIGLRGEQTVADGLQVTTDSAFHRNYFQLFPSAFLNYNLSENHVFGASLSRRINRPSYNQLNPFRSFVDPTTFREGNPFLLPQLTWSSELSYTFLRRFTATFTYSRTTDNITMVFLQNDAERQIVVTHINLDGYEYFATGINGNYAFGKIWSGRFNAQMNYDHFSGEVAGTGLNSSRPSFTFSSNNTFRFGKGISAELGGYYVYRQTIGITIIHPMWALNAGIQKNILDRRGTIRLNIRDIFYKSWPRGTTIFANIDEEFRAPRERRIAILSFTWRFGKQSVQPARRREGGATDEMRRARQSGG